MKRILLFLVAAALAVPCTLSGKDIDLTAYATSFLKEKGRVYASPKCVYKTDRLSVFSDKPNSAFVVLAEGKYQRQLGDIVLAYSLESALEGGSDAMVYDIVGYYDAMLAGLKPARLCLRRTDPWKDGKPVTEPMLQNFSQNPPYNKYFPEENGQKMVAGCGSVALAEILYYHRFPARPQGEGTITLSNGKKYTYDLSKYTLTFDGSEDDLARVTLCAAASMNARATSSSATPTASNDFKGVLVGKWGYSPRCTHVKDCDEPTMASLLLDELDNRRPVIVVQTNEHTYTCDGREGAFVHLNFGWKGYCNGWYRLMLYASDSQRLPFKEMIIGIEPGAGDDKGVGASVSGGDNGSGSGTVSGSGGTVNGNAVTLTAPGTLAATLGEERIMKLSSLSVSGPLNGDDICTLRRMAGAVTDFRQGHGVLTDMDLSGATIVAGGAYYNTRPCYNMTISGYCRDGSGRKYSYDMSKITDKDWQDILAGGLEKRTGCDLSKGEDGKYYSSFFTEDNVMGKYMFEDCENLLHVKLPLSLTELRSNVFLNCRALKSVDNVPEKCDPNAFKGSGLQGK